MNLGEIVLQQELNGDHILIRWIDKGDAVAMHEYINELSQEETYLALQKDEISLDEEKRYVDDMIKNVKSNKLVILLMFVDGELVGISDIHMNVRNAMKHRGIFGISLRNSARGKRLGTLLMNTVVDVARTHLPQMTQINLTCFEGNIAALKLYENLGFKEYGRLPKGLKRKETHHDEILLFKELTS